MFFDFLFKHLNHNKKPPPSFKSGVSSDPKKKKEKATRKPRNFPKLEPIHVSREGISSSVDMKALFPENKNALGIDSSEWEKELEEWAEEFKQLDKDDAKRLLLELMHEFTGQRTFFEWIEFISLSGEARFIADENSVVGIIYPFEKKPDHLNESFEPLEVTRVMQFSESFRHQLKEGHFFITDDQSNELVFVCSLVIDRDSRRKGLEDLFESGCLPREFLTPKEAKWFGFQVDDALGKDEAEIQLGSVLDSVNGSSEPDGAEEASDFNDFLANGSEPEWVSDPELPECDAVVDFENWEEKASEIFDQFPTDGTPCKTTLVLKDNEPFAIIQPFEDDDDYERMTVEATFTTPSFFEELKTNVGVMSVAKGENSKSMKKVATVHLL